MEPPTGVWSGARLFSKDQTRWFYRMSKKGEEFAFFAFFFFFKVAKMPVETDFISPAASPLVDDAG